MLEEFKLFVKGINKDEKVLIMHDTDADGISSAVLFHHFLSTITSSENIIPYFNKNGEKEVKKEMLELIRKENIKKVIILDVAIDGDKDGFKELEMLVESILVVDHHPTLNNLASQKTTFIKADQLGLDYPPHMYNTSKLSYDLISFLKPMGKYAWKASIGIIGDMAYKKWEGFVKRSWKSVEELVECAELIEMATTTGKEGIKESYLSLLHSINPPELKKRLEKYRKIEKEVEKIMKAFEKEGKIDNNKNIIMYEFSSPYDIKSTISNKISLMFPEHTVIIIQKKEDKKELGVSLRNQISKIHMGKVAEEVVKRIGCGRGGGHAPAAGITLPLGKEEEFKKIVKEIINKVLTQSKLH